MGEEAVFEALRAAAALVLPIPFSVRALLVQLAHERGRRMRLHPVEPGWGGTSGWCGAWLEEPEADHIVYVRDPRSTSRNAGTILHEVGHILLDHPGAPLPPGVILSTIGLTEATRVRGRAHFSSPEERAAETFSTLILQAATEHPAATELSDPRLVRLRSRLG